MERKQGMDVGRMTMAAAAAWGGVKGHDWRRGVVENV